MKNKKKRGGGADSVFRNIVRKCRIIDGVGIVDLMELCCTAIKSSNLCKKLNRETVVSTLSGVIGGRKLPPLGCGVFRIEA
jgi:hypothetical protein